MKLYVLKSINEKIFCKIDSEIEPNRFELFKLAL